MSVLAIPLHTVYCITSRNGGFGPPEPDLFGIGGRGGGRGARGGTNRLSPFAARMRRSASFISCTGKS